MSRYSVNNFINNMFDYFFVERLAAKKAKAGKCDHLKWERWRTENDSIGILIQKRNCKVCGWAELETTEYSYHGKTTEMITKKTIEIMDEHLENLKHKENQNDKT